MKTIKPYSYQKQEGKFVAVKRGGSKTMFYADWWNSSARGRWTSDIEKAKSFKDLGEASDEIAKDMPGVAQEFNLKPAKDFWKVGYQVRNNSAARRMVPTAERFQHWIFATPREALENKAEELSREIKAARELLAEDSRDLARVKSQLKKMKRKG